MMRFQKLNPGHRFFLYALAGVMFLGAGQGQAAQPDVPKPVNVRDFGARGDGKTDDTVAIQAAVKEAHSRRRVPKHLKYGYFTSFAEVFFPSGHYVISETIDINSVNVRGEGYAAIEQTDPAKDILFNNLAWRQKISGLTLLGGNVQINLGNSNLDTGHLTVKDCHFYHSDGAAVQTRVGSNSTFFKVENSVFRECRQAVISHCDQSVIRDCWITSSRKMDHQAVIENRGVMMRVETMLGVPRTTGVDQRWIDNYGVLHLSDCRFGGEGGGFTPVVNFAKFRKQTNGTWILMESCTVSAESNYKRKCAIYCEEIPNNIEIRNCIIAVPAVKVDKTIDLMTYFKGARPGMLQFSAHNNSGPFANELPRLLEIPVLLLESMEGQLSMKETEETLAKAVAEVRAREWAPAEAAQFEEHQQQTNPEKVVDITPRTHEWSLTDYMDATDQMNNQFLAVAAAGDDVVVMRRMASGGNWPHVLIRNVTVDLDKYPFLCWRIRDAVNGTPNSHAVRVIDEETGQMVKLVERYHGTEYQAYDLREKLGLSGVRTLSIRFYGLMKGRYTPPGAGQAHSFEHAAPGEYMVLDFLRFESE